MKKNLLFVCLVVLIYSLFSCHNQKNSVKKTINIPHFNICIVPDLSNRISNSKYPKPVDDCDLVNAIIDDIYPNILKKEVDTEQPDKIQITFTSPKIIQYYNINSSLLKFDFADFKSQINRINYLMNRDNKGEFERDKNCFKSEFASVISKARNKLSGADLWTFFNSTLNKSVIQTRSDTVHDKMFDYVHSYDNIIVLFTDGYVEAGIYNDNIGTNKKYHLSGKTVNDFREKFKKSGENDLKKFFNENGYGLVPLNNQVLKNVKILAVEFYDRSLTQTGNASVHPTDGEILELFWTDWMTKSGVKKFKCCKIASSVDEFMDIFHSFAEIKIKK